MIRIERPDGVKYAPGVSLRSYDASELSEATGTETGSESLVQQQFLEESDVNTIVRRFGLAPSVHADVAGGVYGDFTGIEDYQGAIAAIQRAEDGFMRLPPQVREKFDNDPGRLISMAHSMSEDQFLSVFANEVKADVPSAEAQPPAVDPVVG